MPRNLTLNAFHVFPHGLSAESCLYGLVLHAFRMHMLHPDVEMSQDAVTAWSSFLAKGGGESIVSSMFSPTTMMSRCLTFLRKYNTRAKVMTGVFCQSAIESAEKDVSCFGMLAVVPESCSRDKQRCQQLIEFGQISSQDK